VIGDAAADDDDDDDTGLVIERAIKVAYDQPSSFSNILRYTSATAMKMYAGRNVKIGALPRAKVTFHLATLKMSTRVTSLSSYGTFSCSNSQRSSSGLLHVLYPQRAEPILSALHLN